MGIEGTRTKTVSYFDEEGNEHEVKHEIAFLGELYGIVLSKRDYDNRDRHVLFTVVEKYKPYTWRVSKEVSASAWWMAEIQECMNAAHEWMEKNCKHAGLGYEFKTRRRTKKVKS